MNSIKYLIYSIILSALFFLSCGQTTDDNSITADQLREKMSADTNLVLLDVRTPAELEDKSLGHIDGVLNIPVQELESRLSELEKYKNDEIYVICRSGRRSAAATNILLKKEFKAINVEGGMIQYRATENKDE
ncbi:MAG: rhodanese-like domain-containing protein [Bacteroidetes bacterium]|nr:rhodanese-like domain-containing protein [Bacteroidota bacterium]